MSLHAASLFHFLEAHYIVIDLIDNNFKTIVEVIRTLELFKIVFKLQ